jgi:PAS domain S-box-containing protein
MIRGTRILIVEDEGIVAEDIQEILENLGSSVTGIASSGEEAVGMASETRPDLVLMDIMLGSDMDGVEAAQEIYDSLNIPVVYLTAYADENTLQRAKMTGAFGYILKPFEERDLRSTIEVALHKHGTESELRERAWRSSAALRSVGDAVITTDAKGRVEVMNPVAQTLTGWALDEARGKPLNKVISITSDEAGVLSESTVARIIRDGALIGLVDHNVLTAKDGTKVPIEGSGAPIKDDKGRIIGAVLLLRPVSWEGRDEINVDHAFDEIIGNDEEIQSILGLLPDIATSDSTVLIEGPSGSGKELFARAIHKLCGRKEGRYVVVSCGALPDTLLESELFGYVKGAFTGAEKDKPGRFALAEGGTIFLDEIGDISRTLQAKLLRVLEQKEYEPLGGTATVKADVRIIAATNRTLSEIVARGLFREDLFYRLNVVRIVLPPLSSRREDIPLLINHFIRGFNVKMGKKIERMSDDALAIMMKHDFRGNVRELENVIEHAFVMCRGPEITLQHLPAEIRAGASEKDGEEGEPPNDPLRQAEAKVIETMLRKHNGNRRRTADELGISKTTLWRKMRKYRITYKPLDERRK